MGVGRSSWRRASRYTLCFSLDTPALPELAFARFAAVAGASAGRRRPMWPSTQEQIPISSNPYQSLHKGGKA
jgi:hypothetical protein